jgi:hypothetical protein
MLLAGEASAQYIANHHEYDIACNENGYVLSSKYPVAHRFGKTGVETHWIVERDNLYLGKNCDAFHKHFRTGTWCWANGGFGAKFTDFEYWFPRQELYCPNDRPLNDSLDCAC